MCKKKGIFLSRVAKICGCHIIDCFQSSIISPPRIYLLHSDVFQWRFWGEVDVNDAFLVVADGGKVACVGC